ncbi:MAG: hypothetical protein HGA87_01550 [Desulfobulbaceae bacterium]|nr:hypothetical protein [Desulfobulbaceae bacterium]
MKFYRYDAYVWGDFLSVGMRCEEYRLIRETPKGYWIEDEWSIDKRWVSKTARKRYAYPTKAEALDSFIARKRRQISILRHQAKHAQEKYDYATANYQSILR